jgi:hypothetical protein
MQATQCRAPPMSTVANRMFRSFVLFLRPDHACANRPINGLIGAGTRRCVNPRHVT